MREELYSGFGFRASIKMAIVLIREYVETDWPSVWSIFWEVVEAGDTYAYDPAWSADEARKVWVEIKSLLHTQRVDHKPPRVDSRMIPGVWVEPKFVVTILADEITRSPTHTAAQDEQGRGLALRFPRVVNFIWDDKSPEDATTTKERLRTYHRGSRSLRPPPPEPPRSPP